LVSSLLFLQRRRDVAYRRVDNNLDAKKVHGEKDLVPVEIFLEK
jgi:hypothetical protein